MLLAVLFLACWASTSQAAPAVIRSHAWEFGFDETKGEWQSLRWNGVELVQAAPGVAPVDVQLTPDQWLIGKSGEQVRFVRHSWDEKAATLIMVRQNSGWEMEESLQFGALGNPNRLSRSLRLTYRPEPPATGPAKFHRVRFVTPLAKAGRLLFPMRDPFDEHRGGDCAALPVGFRGGSAGGVGPLLLQQAADRTLLFVNDGRRDRALTSLIVEDADGMAATQFFDAAGWAEPGVAQNIGTAFLDVVPKDLDTALGSAIWQWYEDVGIKVPSDRPAWVRSAALYSFHPGGTVGSSCKDLGGFAAAKERLLPIVKRLGFGALWTLPLETRGIYWPQDYYKFQEGLGSPEEYRELVAEVHRLGLKFWQDNVPHGGSPKYGRERGDKPWWLVFDEKGDALDYWCFDFREPLWQQRIAAVADHYVRQFGVDGYRVDAVGGSHAMNWRRAGFPPLDPVPANVPADWWREELAKAGGSVPALPYERGSLTQREGGMQMLHAIRSAVKQGNAKDGAVLAEVQGAPYMQEADVVYDFNLAHQLLLEMRHRPAVEFVPGLKRLLEEQKLSEPRGTVRMRYVESHDTLRAQGWYGIAATRALMALTAWIDGMPMIYHDADLGQGHFLQWVLGVRAALPELQSGEAFYQAVPCSVPNVFTCLRTLGDKASIVAINLSPEPCSATIQLPAWFGKPGEVTELLTRWGGRKCGPGEVKLDLYSWEPAVLCSRQVASPPGTGIRIWGGGGAPTAPKVVEREGTVEVSTGVYRLEIARRTGLIHSFENENGKPVLGAGEIVLDAAAKDGEELIAKAEMERETQKEALVLRLHTTLKTGGGVTLTYRCLPDRVELDAALDEATPAQRVGLVFAGAKTDRWEINTAEGVLEDWFTPRHGAGKTGQSTIYHEPQGTEMIWQSETVPLDPDAPWLRSLQRGGTGAHLRLSDPLRTGLANAMVLERFGGREGWHAAFFLRDRACRVPAGTLPERCTLVLHPRDPVNRTSDRLERNLPVTYPSLRNDSTDWVVENAHYRVALRRTGGVIRELWAKEPALRLVAKEQDVYTDRGFRTERARRASAADDVETAVRVWRDGGTLRLRFEGLLRDDDRFGLVRPPIRFSTEYAFDDGPGFRVRWGVLSEGNVREDSAFLAWMARVPEAGQFVITKGGQELARGKSERGRRMGETAKLEGAPVPDGVAVMDAEGRELLQLNEIAVRAAGPLRNVFVHGQNLFLAWLDGPKQDILRNRWYEASAVVAAGAAKAGKAPVISWRGEETASEKELIKDGSFESAGAGLFAVGQQRNVAFGAAPARLVWSMPAGGSLTTETVHSGRQCAKVVNTTGEYLLFTQPFEARGRVKVSAWIKGENVVAGDGHWKKGWLDLSYQTLAGETRHLGVGEATGTFDWRKFERVVELPADARALTIRAGLNGATGTLWIDDVTVESAK